MTVRIVIAWVAILSFLSAVGVCTPAVASDTFPDGRYRLELVGGAGVLASSAGTQPKAPSGPNEGEDEPGQSGDAAGDESVLVLERQGEAWGPSLAGQFNRDGRPTVARGILRGAAGVPAGAPTDDGEALRVAADVLIGGLPRMRDWLNKDPPVLVECEFVIRRKDGKLTGTWRAKAGGRDVSGKLVGHVDPLRSCDLPARDPRTATCRATTSSR